MKIFINEVEREWSGSLIDYGTVLAIAKQPAGATVTYVGPKHGDAQRAGIMHATSGAIAIERRNALHGYPHRKCLVNERSIRVADIFRSAEYARTALVRRDAKVSDCLSGKCGCANAGKCRFVRCDNCDYPKDRATGKTLVDHSCGEYDVCPTCEGPLNERRIYGSLVD